MHSTQYTHIVATEIKKITGNAKYDQDTNEHRSAFVHRIQEFIVVLDNVKYSLLLKFDTLSVFS